MIFEGAYFISPCLRSSCNKRRTFWEDPMVPESPLAVQRLSDSKSFRWEMTRPQWLSRRRIDSHLDSRTHSLRWHSSWPGRSSSCQIRHKLKTQIPSELLDSSRVCSHISSLPHPRNILGYKPGNQYLFLLKTTGLTSLEYCLKILRPAAAASPAARHCLSLNAGGVHCAALGESPW